MYNNTPVDIGYKKTHEQTNNNKLFKSAPYLHSRNHSIFDKNTAVMLVDYMAEENHY